MGESKYKQLGLAVVLTLTLGLAPYVPEPHIFGKVRWVLGGAKGMQPIDYFDLLMHGAPWIFLIYQLIKVLPKR